MGNKNIIKYYNRLAKNITDPTMTRNKAKDFSIFDIRLMNSFANKNKTLLDLGAGTGLLINHLIDSFKLITAVEKYPEFSRFIHKYPKIKVINDDIFNFLSNNSEKFDFVSLFGVMNYFDKREASKIYKKAADLLNTNGIMIVKHQMGVMEDVLVNGYSKELQTDYYSEYRYVKNEIELIKNSRFLKVEVVDIYPPEFNRWDNTHFYALICYK